MVKKTGCKAATKPKTATTTVVDDPHVTGEFNAEYAANRRDDEDPPQSHKSHSRSCSRSHSRTWRPSPLEQIINSTRVSSGLRRSSFLSVPPGSSSLANNASLRSPVTAAWVSGGSPNYLGNPQHWPSSIQSELNSRRLDRSIDDRSVQSNTAHRSRAKKPSIPTTIPEHTDRSKSSGKRSGGPPSFQLCRANAGWESSASSSWKSITELMN